jgi:hypothetical protein
MIPATFENKNNSKKFLNWLDKECAIIRNKIKDTDIFTTIEGGVIIRFQNFAISKCVEVIFEEGGMRYGFGADWTWSNLINEEAFMFALVRIADIYPTLSPDNLPF